jgi:hypothetical protein
MSYYNDASWNTPAPGRQSSWEQPQQPPSRSGTGQNAYNGGGPPIHMDAGSSSTVNSDAANAFASQFEGMLQPPMWGIGAVSVVWGAQCDRTWQWQTPAIQKTALTPHHRGRPRRREPRQERQALRSWLPSHPNGCQPSRVHAPDDGRRRPSALPRLRYGPFSFPTQTNIH